jgi:hypothetical protein
VLLAIRNLVLLSTVSECYFVGRGGRTATIQAYDAFGFSVVVDDDVGGGGVVMEGAFSSL